MPRSQTRYQIFVSSTYKDLIEERQAAVEAILRAGHIPAGMELFAAQNQPQMDVIKEWIEGSDVFCLLLGARYGSIEPLSGKSYVECEYDHALSLGKPIFSIVLDDARVDANVERLGRKVALEQDNPSMLKTFHNRITSTLVRIVGNPDSIKVAIFESIGALERRFDIEGWVRARDAGTPARVSEELARLSAENARLLKEAAAGATKRESLIDGRSFREWAKMLATFSISDWDTKAQALSKSRNVDLFSVLRKFGHQLGGGVSNAAVATPHESYLFSVASTLESLGLAEAQKTPAGVHWQRLGLSAAGKRLYSAILANSASADPLMSAGEFAASLGEALASGTATALPSGTPKAPSGSRESATPAVSGSKAPATKAHGARRKA